MIERFHIPGAPAPAGPYSHAVRAGDFIYVSGQGSFNTETGQFELGDIRNETRIVITNIQKSLEGAGASLADVVKKQVAQAKKVTLIDLSASHSLKAVVFPALSDANLAEKCTFSVVKSIPATEPVWQGQTISLARQALYKAVDALHKI